MPGRSKASASFGTGKGVLNSERIKDFVPIIPECSDTVWTEESNYQRQYPQCYQDGVES